MKIAFVMMWCAASISTTALGDPQNGQLQIDPDHAEQEPQPRSRTAVAFKLEGMISPLSGAIWQRKFQEALDQRPDVIILQIDSPGGYLSTTMELVDMLHRAQGVETVAFIDHEAISGAALTALAADKIVIAPGARIGDAGLIVEGADSAFRYADAKARSDLVARVRTIAQKAGRPAALAEAMVDKDAVVIEARHRQDDRQAFFTEDEFASLPDAEQWVAGKQVFESKANRFLTLDGRRAVELGLANGNATDLESLADVLEVAQPIQVIPQNRIDIALVILNSPIITGLILIIGVGALLFELGAPGIGIGGLVATLCFGTFFWSRFLGGTAGWLEVMVFVLGLTFLAMELFVLPGFGVFGVAGLGMVSVALVMASRHVLLPESARDLQQLGTSVGTVAAVLVGGGVLLIAFLSFAENLPGPLRRLTLQPPSSGGQSMATAIPQTVEAGWSVVQVGEEGVAISTLRPAGKVQFGQHMVDVITEGDFIDADQRVRVIQKSGTRIVVRQI